VPLRTAAAASSEMSISPGMRVAGAITPVPGGSDRRRSLAMRNTLLALPRRSLPIRFVTVG